MTKPNLQIPLAAALAATLLAGCASTGSGPPQTRRVDYICQGGERVTVVFMPRIARIVSVEPPIEMPQLASGSGFRFGTVTNTIEGQGNHMTWTRGRMAPVRCREVSRR